MAWRMGRRAPAVATAAALVAAVPLLATVGTGPAAAATRPATVPPPPAGAPAVESAPRSLVGLQPQVPAGVMAASAAPGSTWKPENAVYGTASRDDIAVKGAGGTTIRVDETYPTTASGQPAKGPFPVLLTMTPYGKGQVARRRRRWPAPSPPPSTPAPPPARRSGSPRSRT
ncbi:MAG TPA: hypothetical protein VKV25_06790 [Acidimicrobiales bacterium]|nr:hypothetical protein [Acidimicrobiales bacterium]